jgi:hypothetical protein
MLLSLTVSGSIGVCGVSGRHAFWVIRPRSPAWVTTAHQRRARMMLRPMPKDPAAPSDQLDDLSPAELRRRAVDLARSRHDAEFFLRLLEYTPAAEAISARYADAEADMEQFPLDYLRNTPADRPERL